ncbi:MAG: hypothetical protein MUO75_03660 [Actinobacteria bacterium]|nr:hypothetical protein [Actinomycetota bacterium]
MNDDEYKGAPQWSQERRRNAGKISLNRGIAALAVAAAGNLLGFLIPWAANSAQSSNGPLVGRVVFFPMGGIVSLMLAILAISIGRKVHKFVESLSDTQRMRLNSSMDLEKQRRYASTGVALGIISIVINPLLAFGLIAIVGLA